MKNKKIIKIAIVTIIIIETLILIYFIATKNNTQLSKTIQLNGEKMTDSSRITELEKQIDSLNAEHTTYGQYIQTSKAKIATAITNGGVSTSADASIDTIEINIKKLASGETADKVKVINALKNRGVTIEETATYEEIATAIANFREQKVLEQVDNFWFAKGASGNRTIDISSRGYLEVLRVDLKCTNADGGYWSVKSFDTNKIVVSYSSYGPSSSFSTTVYAVK